MPQLYNNQRVIRTIKMTADKYHPYATFNIAARQQARIELNGNAFKLYDYFCSFAVNHKETIIRQNIEKKTGLAKASYLRAFDELKEKGYVQKDASTDQAEHYIFVEDGTIIG